ncbi:MAG: hypothetical protein ACFB2W_28800 [Leptolyngbyaceae cyanobacterium]
MELAALLASFLSPFLPHLLKLGKPVAEEAGKALGGKLGEGTWETAKTAWGKLSAKVTAKPLAKGAAEALAENGEDEDAQEIWVSQLKKVLAANPELARELQTLLEKEAKVVNQVALKGVKADSIEAGNLTQEAGANAERVNQEALTDVEAGSIKLGDINQRA